MIIFTPTAPDFWRSKIKTFKYRACLDFDKNTLWNAVSVSAWLHYFIKIPFVFILIIQMNGIFLRISRRVIEQAHHKVAPSPVPHSFLKTEGSLLSWSYLTVVLQWWRTLHESTKVHSLLFANKSRYDSVCESSIVNTSRCVLFPNVCVLLCRSCDAFLTDNISDWLKNVHNRTSVRQTLQTLCTGHMDKCSAQCFENISYVLFSRVSTGPGHTLQTARSRRHE